MRGFFSSRCNLSTTHTQFSALKYCSFYLIFKENNLGSSSVPLFRWNVHSPPHLQPHHVLFYVYHLWLLGLHKHKEIIIPSVSASVLCVCYAVERGTDVACGAPNFTDCGPFFVNFPVESNYYGTVITFSLELCVIPCSATFYAWGRTLLMRCDEWWTTRPRGFVRKYILTHNNKSHWVANNTFCTQFLCKHTELSTENV